MIATAHLRRPPGVDFKDRVMRVSGKEYVVEIWDSAGQERFDAITTQYYKVDSTIRRMLYV
jgi:GTPase SAR1 family protein